MNSSLIKIAFLMQVSRLKSFSTFYKPVTFAPPYAKGLTDTLPQNILHNTNNWNKISTRNPDLTFSNFDWEKNVTFKTCGA